MKTSGGVEPVSSDHIKIIFVILHFNTYKETVGCVRSIKKNIDTDDHMIIVVDNGSKNGSGIRLKKKYEKDRLVKIIINEKNEGFARGNNLGIMEARKYDPKYIVCVNNDTILPQRNYYDVLESVFEKSKAAIIGPAIFLADYSYRNINRRLRSPEYYTEWLRQYKTKIDNYISPHEAAVLNNQSKIKSFLLKNKYVYRLNYFRSTAYLYHQKRKNRKEFIRIVSRAENNIDTGLGENEINAVINGCCMIFTPVFFEKLDGFDDRTFMYREEEILLADVLEKELTTLYCPGLIILHKEGTSTGRTQKDQKKRMIMKYGFYEKSTNILVEKLRSAHLVYNDKKEMI